MSAGYAHVALPLPLATPYTYRIPEALADRIVPGARVLVPVRRRRLIGIVVGVDDGTSDARTMSGAAASPTASRTADPAARSFPSSAAPGTPAVAIKDVLDAPDPEPALPLPLLRTAEWIAGYYGTPIGITLKSMLPGALWGEQRVDEADRATERLVVLGDARPSLLERERLFKRKTRQRELYETLESLGGRVPARHLTEQLGFSEAVVHALVKGGLARIELAERVRDPFADVAGTPPPAELTAAQAAALRAVESLGPGEGALLFGVTGSGKTLVYLEAVRRELAAGRGAIVLVPEIGLTPQTVSRLRGAFGGQVAVLHSGLSDGERADAWRLLRRGERRVAVGARSAVFAPVPNLGIIVVDEEHESTYKNGESPRYHTRDVAAVRARLEGARLVLGTATPALETIVRVERDAFGDAEPTRFALPPVPRAARLRLIRLPERIGTRPLPPVELVDLRIAPKVPGTGPVPWSERLDEAICGALARGEQALLLLNRRGWAAFLQCPDCGEVWRCARCSVSLTVHRAPPGLRCHYCGHDEPLPLTCRACASPVQEMRGVGTQQLERVLAERFPTARIARMDLDSTSTKWSHQRILGAVERGEVDVLVGTQMIAKGLDFPNVTVVGVVDADTGLYLPDFRSAERSFQLLAQVAGRAGRGPKGGRVLVQTRNPRHHALRRAAAHDTEGFLAEELALRHTPPYPPIVSLVNLVVSGVSEVEVGRRTAHLADWCRALAARHNLRLDVLGPAPCPLARIKDRWRWHILLKGEPTELGRVVRYAARKLPRQRDVRVVIDRDPAAVL